MRIEDEKKYKTRRVKKLLRVMMSMMSSVILMAAWLIKFGFSLA